MKFLKDHKRIVVKIGSALLVNRETGKLRRDWLNALCDDMAALRKAGAEIIIVSSGAIALGRFQLGLPKGPLKLEESQAAAAAGQILLAPAWAEGLARGELTAGQLLLTLNDTEERRRYLNARATVETLLKLGAVPVINENDTVATSEIRYGDNDRLGARVATMAGADCLVLLSDIDGLYTKPPQDNPDAEHIPLVPEITPEIAAMAGKSGTEIASGGMHTKIEAGKIATTGGTSMVIASGKELHPLQAIDEGARCTWFLTGTNPVTARKKWISGHVETIGSITIDQGASKALSNGRSLLPAGVKSANGNFRRGDPVLILNEAGQELARGLIDYDFDDAIKIIGRKSHEFEALLGYAGRSAMVHRDNMVLSNNSSTKNSRTTEEEND